VNVIRVCELFAGIGGFRYGLEKASNQFKTVYANELDKWAASIYRHHWPDGTLYEGDIRSIQASDIPDFDILCGGFPCQPFSLVSRKRKGFADPRGTLIYEILRIAKEKQPPLIFLENVPGLLSIDQGDVFQTILEKVGELGYVCEWRVLNSRFFGVPQSRRRVFIVAHTAKPNRGGRTVFPIPQSNGDSCEKTLVGREIVSPTPATSDKTNCVIGGHTFVTQSVVPTITTHVGTGGGSEPLVVVPCPTAAKLRDRFRVYADCVPTLMSRMGTGGGKVAFVLGEDNPWGMRRLTCVECERLQGFPDNWTQYGLTAAGEQIELSNTQRYKTLGNAVTTNVIAAVGKLIVDFFLERRCNSA
jgi:DNA (cytosine-5)-methyltransferase 1